MPTTYSSYLNVDDLIALQSPRAPEEHDEMLFIIIHQVYELWFKQILHELDYAMRLLDTDDAVRAGHTLQRIRTIFKTLVSQVDILETMTPLEFLSFRDYLESASGFQSYQFREMEFALGHKLRRVLRHYPVGTAARQRLEARYQQPTLWDSFLGHLHRAGYDIPEAVRERDVREPLPTNEDVQQALVMIYRQDPPLAQICEQLVDLDEGIQEWRYRHVKMVERTIGMKQGTGGSSGAQYLRGTLFRPLFPDLWAIRSEL